MSHPEIIIVPAVFGIPAAVTLAFRYFRHRETMARLAAGTGQLPGSDARLMRVEQALEAVALEVERISEGQRFVTHLLAERAAAEQGPRGALPEARAPYRDARHVTPH